MSLSQPVIVLVHGASVQIKALAERQSVQASDLDGTGVLTWDFTVGPSGTTNPSHAEFHFSKPLVSAPSGLLAILEFPAKYSIVCPATGPSCTSRTRQIAFGLPIRRDISRTFTPCLQFRGGPHGVFVGIAPDCTDPRGLKSTKATPSH